MKRKAVLGRADLRVCAWQLAKKAMLARLIALSCVAAFALSAFASPAFASPAVSLPAVSLPAVSLPVAPLSVAPLSATIATAQPMLPDVANGKYLVDVTLEGGTGRASIETPAQIVVDNDTSTATIVWSSPNYDYMIVDGKRYMPTNSEGNSTFDIPVLAFDEPFQVVADTTAMSTPHEIAYELTFDSASLKPQEAAPQEAAPQMPSALALATMAAAVIGVAAVPQLRKRHHSR